MTKNNKKLAILIPNLAGGGAERVALNLANFWVSVGFEVHLVLLKKEGQLISMLAPSVHVIELPSPHVRNLPFGLMSYLRKYQPDAMLACMWPLTVIAVISRFFAQSKCRLMLVEHTTWSIDPLFQRKGPRIIIKMSMHLLFPRADHVITVSNGARNDLARVASLSCGAILSVYNPIVDTSNKSPLASPPLHPVGWCSEAHYRILAIGTLKAIKDFGTLLQAFALLLKDKRDAHLLILGEGECRPKLELLAKELGIASQVHMPGFFSNTTPYYQHADLFVLSSKGEGLPTVIIESLANGTPVVSTDCPSGPREILQNGRYGRLVPVGDIEALSKAMIDSLQCKHDVNALKDRAKDFSIEKIGKTYLNLMLPNWDARPEI